jgi:osmotically-inducible protein OsmY
MSKSVRRILLLTVLVAGVTGGAVAKENDYRPDSWITMKTKLALLTDADMPGSSINVDTVNGRVTLHGKVETNQEKAEAAEIAKKIEGTAEVRNLLQVVPSSKKSAVKDRDDDIKKRIKTAFDKDQSLKSSKISVQSVNNGVVLLQGKATSMSDHLRAVQIARGTSGVRRVATEVESPVQLTERDMGQPMTAPTKTAGHDQGSGKPAANAKADKPKYDASDKPVSESVSDSWITTQTKLRLLANDATPALEINVDTDYGVVTLFGVVPTEAAKKAAEAEAREVKGVRSVNNALQVVPESAQKAVEASDEEVKKAVTSALDGRDSLSDVDVEVTNGVARLTGTVTDPTERLQASVVARATPGVRSVRNDLRVESQESVARTSR